MELTGTEINQKNSQSLRTVIKFDPASKLFFMTKITLKNEIRIRLEKNERLFSQNN